MGMTPSTNADLQSALSAFPEDAALVMSLFASDSNFRSVCEDYRLAQEGVAAFTPAPGAEPREEVHDYLRLVCELKVEVGHAIHAARGRMPPASRE